MGRTKVAQRLWWVQPPALPPGAGRLRVGSPSDSWDAPFALRERSRHVSRCRWTKQRQSPLQAATALASSLEGTSSRAWWWRMLCQWPQFRATTWSCENCACFMQLARVFKLQLRSRCSFCLRSLSPSAIITVRCVRPVPHRCRRPAGRTCDPTCACRRTAMYAGTQAWRCTQCEATLICADCSPIHPHQAGVLPPGQVFAMRSVTVDFDQSSSSPILCTGQNPRRSVRERPNGTRGGKPSDTQATQRGRCDHAALNHTRIDPSRGRDSQD